MPLLSTISLGMSMMAFSSLVSSFSPHLLRLLRFFVEASPVLVFS